MDTNRFYRIKPKMFIDRIALVDIGDPNYVSPTRRRRELVVSLDDLLNSARDSNTSGVEYHPIDPFDMTYKTSNWWEEVNTAFFGLTYLPFFSNCREYDSHIHISKLLEVHPSPHCIHRPVTGTIPVDPYNFFDYFSIPGPVADECLLPADELAQRFPEGWCRGDAECAQKKELYPGMEMSCQYEENTYRAGTLLR